MGLGGSDPRRLGPYRLLGVLGSGEFGRVYAGRGAPRGSVRRRLVAVRALRPELLRDRQVRARLRRELRVGADCGSPWVAPAVDGELDGDRPWVAWTLVPGTSLRRLVLRHGPLPEPALPPLAGALAHGLAALHRVGTAHGAPRPGTVLLHLDRPRLVDHGLALTVPDGGPARDVFDLAVLLVFAVVARPPFRGLRPVASAAPPGPDLTGVPEEVRPTLLACLHPDPARRPSPRELAEALDPQGRAEEPAHQWLPEAYRRQIEADRAALRRLVGRRFGAVG